MITFIWIFAAVILLGAAYFVVSGATQRKRTGQAGASHVAAEQSGDGAPTIGRAVGKD